jgi:hypothetical protein
MNLKNRKLLRTSVLVILYLLHAQAFLTGKIREELRTELGLMNLILVPLCVIINLYFVIVMLSKLKNKSMEKSDMFYIILSLLLYGLMGYNMAA